jgi:hypothetical protein
MRETFAGEAPSRSRMSSGSVVGSGYGILGMTRPPRALFLATETVHVAHSVVKSAQAIRKPPSSEIDWPVM